MVTRETMMAPLLKACPSFQSSWEDFLSDWAETPNDLPLYLALGELAHHLVAMLSRGETAQFRDIFAVVERWIVDGDPYVSEAAVVGLLENLRSTSLHRETKPNQFRQFLGPNALHHWGQLHHFWKTVGEKK